MYDKTSLALSIISTFKLKTFISMSGATSLDIEGVIEECVFDFNLSDISEVGSEHKFTFRYYCYYHSCLAIMANCNLYDYAADNTDYKRNQLLSVLKKICNDYHQKFLDAGGMPSEISPMGANEAVILTDEIVDCGCSLFCDC